MNSASIASMTAGSVTGRVDNESPHDNGEDDDAAECASSVGGRATPRDHWAARAGTALRRMTSAARIGERWWWYVAAIVAGLVLLLIALGPTLLSPLGPIDDHEIVSISRELQGQPFLVVATDWAQEPNRFRPAYYILRTIEAAAWGTNPLPWHIVRFGLAVLTVALGAWLFGRHVSRPLAVLAALLIVVGPQAEAWYRLGPQEAYSTPIILGSLVASLSGRARLGIALAVLAALTKETNLAIAPLLVIPAWQAGARASVIVGLAAIASAALATVATFAAPPGDLSNQGRYLLPWIIGVIWLGVFAFRRVPRAFGPAVAVLLIIGMIDARQDALSWAGRDVAWSAMVAAPPATYVTSDIEMAHAFEVYTGRPATLVAVASQ